MERLGEQFCVVGTKMQGIGWGDRRGMESDLGRWIGARSGEPGFLPCDRKSRNNL